MVKPTPRHHDNAVPNTHIGHDLGNRVAGLGANRHPVLEPIHLDGNVLLARLCRQRVVRANLLNEFSIAR